MYIVSACLLGKNCRYNGGNNFSERVAARIKGHNYIAVCPETAGGCPVPREPGEIRNGRVYDPAGEDLTDLFREGAEKAFAEAIELADRLGESLEMAILKARSPSCGCRQIYDGTFSHTVVKGDGVFADLILRNGIEVISEEEC